MRDLALDKKDDQEQKRGQKKKKNEIKLEIKS